MNARNDIARREKKKGASVYWTPIPPGPNGEKVRIEEIPASLTEEADRARHGMLDTWSL